MPKSTMPQVKNIVFLMLENRSLDNLLGWLYELPLRPATGKPAPPDRVYPEGSPRAFDGLKKGTFFNPSANGTEVEVVPIPDGYNKAVPLRDPFEALKQLPVWWNGVMNQFFGGVGDIGRMPTPDSGPPPMKGFLQDYYSFVFPGLDPNPLFGLDILWTYQPARAPVINSLAMQYAVSDRWHASVPSDTNPNRAYSLCGTSLGRESNLHLNAVETFDRPTIFHALANGGGKNWGLYYRDIWKENKCYTDYTFPGIAGAPNGEIAEFGAFQAHAAAGTLPAFSYLEPKWTSPGMGPSKLVTGTDYHPNAEIGQSEDFLRDVYNAVRSGPQWHETLFIVTFDEHGGNFDHVAPGWNAQNPDGKIGENGFEFNLYGARVPTILISPFVHPRTVFRPKDPGGLPFDHTSTIKTLLGWAGVDLNAVDFGKRMALAPTFDYILEDRAVNGGKTLDLPDQGTAPVVADSAQALAAGLPSVAARSILEKNDTPDAIRNEIARYRRDPARFEAGIANIPRGK